MILSTNLSGFTVATLGHPTVPSHSVQGKWEQLHWGVPAPSKASQNVPRLCRPGHPLGCSMQDPVGSLLIKEFILTRALMELQVLKE